MGTIGLLPAKAVVAAVEREREMIEDDILNERPFPETDTFSIFNFCLFIHAVATGADILPAILPEVHVEFYWQIVVRLVNAGEFPADALEKFNAAFLPKDYKLPLAA